MFRSYMRTRFVCANAILHLWDVMSTTFLTLIPVRCRGYSRSTLAGRSVALVKSGWLDRLAPLVFVLVWSTGFIGARIGTRYAAPFTVLALRLAIASCALALLTVAFRSSWPNRSQDYRRSAIIGILLHAGYLGGTFVAVNLGLPVSVSALVVSLQPVLVAALSGPILGERLITRQWIGVALGFMGVIIVLTPGLTHHSTTTYTAGAVIAAIVSLLSTTAATIMQKRFGASIPMLAGTSVQYAAAAVVLVIAAAMFENFNINWTPAFVGILAWMIGALSIGAVLLMFWLLRRGTAASFSSLYFLVPPVTAVMAYLLFGEHLPPVALIGLAVSSLGVLLVRERVR